MEVEEEAKPFKIRGDVKSGLIGIVAGTLHDVIAKGCAKLEKRTQGVRVYLEEDGTLIDDDYFKFVKPDTKLVLCEPGKWKGDSIRHIIQQLLVKLNEDRHREEVNDIFHNAPPEERSTLADIITQRGNIEAENKEEDPDWFAGMEPRFKTKSKVMFVKAQERVRSYYAKMKETLKAAGKDFSQASLVHYEMVLKEMKDALKDNEYHGFYFKRTCDRPDRLCNDQGWFECQGLYNNDACLDFHIINPYSNAASLTFFSTWNLDHVIEKQRAVIPGLRDAIQNCPRDKQVNTKYFYGLLFTLENLKLVDIRCHDKGIHVGRVINKKRLYRRPVSYT